MFNVQCSTTPMRGRRSTLLTVKDPKPGFFYHRVTENTESTEVWVTEYGCGGMGVYSPPLAGGEHKVRGESVIASHACGVMRSAEATKQSYHCFKSCSDSLAYQIQNLKPQDTTPDPLDPLKSKYILRHL